MDFNMQSKEPTLMKEAPSNKRTHLEFMRSQQLMHRFKSKADFVHYFSEARKFVNWFPMSHCSSTLLATSDDVQQGFPQSRVG
jgi:hypothetical protein